MVKQLQFRYIIYNYKKLIFTFYHYIIIIMNNMHLKELKLETYPSIIDIEILSKILDYKNIKLNHDEINTNLDKLSVHKILSENKKNISQVKK
jgi:hypothetical protein